MKVRIGAVLVLISLTNYSFATVNTCKSLFVKSKRPVLSLKKSSAELVNVKPFEEKYSAFEVKILKKAAGILSDRKASLEQKQQGLIKLMRQQNPKSFEDIFQNSKIVIEYMLSQNYLRDINEYNPKDRILSAFVKSTIFAASNSLASQIYGREKNYSELIERQFIKSRSEFRWFIYSEVTRRFATATNYSNIIEFILKDTENTQARVPLSAEEIQIRRGLIYDLVQSKNVNGLGLNIIILIAETAYKIHNSKDLEALLEPLAGFNYIQGNSLKLDLSEAQRKFFMHTLYRIINFSRNKYLSTEGNEYLQKIKKFTETLPLTEIKDLKQQLENTLSELGLVKPDLLKLKPEDFVDSLVAVNLNRDQLDLLVRDYIKKQGKISNETYFLLNELDLKANTIEFLEQNLASKDLFNL